MILHIKCHPISVTLLKVILFFVHAILTYFLSNNTSWFFLSTSFFSIILFFSFDDKAVY